MAEEKMNHKADTLNSIFLFPLYDDFEILVEWEGVIWSNESNDRRKLERFSEACTDFDLVYLEKDPPYISFKKSENPFGGHWIKVIFEAPFEEEFECSFYDMDTNTYAPFVVPVGTTMLVLSWDENIILGVDLISEDFSSEWKDSSEPFGDCHSEDNGGSLKEENECLKAELEEAKRKLANCSVKEEEEQKREMGRLRKLITELIDKERNEAFTQTLDSDIDRQTLQLKELREKNCEKQHSLEHLNRELLTIQQQVQKTESQVSQTLKDISASEQMLKEKTTESEEYEKKLQNLLNELKVDVQTIRLYENQDSVDTMIYKSGEWIQELESKLKTLVMERQLEIDRRFNRIEA